MLLPLLFSAVPGTCLLGSPMPGSMLFSHGLTAKEPLLNFLKVLSHLEDLLSGDIQHFLVP